VLSPDDRWIWDFWHVQDDDGLHHLYYLQAPRSLGDPELRHRNATVGHATSRDLVDWQELGTVLEPGQPGSPDATATWTGSVVRGDDGRWRMFYTGSTFLTPDSHANIEVVALATSDDLHTWVKDESVVLTADARWYERLGDSSWPEEAWRDPWVHRDATGWRMLLTARSATGAVDDRGVVGSATSPDLRDWTIGPPLSTSGAGFAHVEVLQSVVLDGRRFLVFSANRAVLTAERRERGGATGTWIAPWDDEIDLARAVNLTGPALYSGRVIETTGGPVLLAFRLSDDGEEFVGGICDPLPIRVTGERVELAPGDR